MKALRRGNASQILDYVARWIHPVMEHAQDNYAFAPVIEPAGNVVEHVGGGASPTRRQFEVK